LSIIASVYNEYSASADMLDDFLKDVRAVTIKGIKANAKKWGYGLLLFYLAKPLSTYVPSPMLRPVVVSLLYYFATSEIIKAIKVSDVAGAYRGGSGGWITSSSYVSPQMYGNGSSNTGNAGRL